MSKLPVHTILPELFNTLKHQGDAILQAPPGSGKTTAVPLSLLAQPGLIKGKILLLEPRRLAARNVANYMAQQLGEAAGETVGYRIRLESRISPRTRIEVVTEGVLLRLMQDDPSLEAYDLIIFDEFHERSLQSDLGLAMVLYARELFREHQALRLLVMSATLDNQALQAVLPNASLITANGRLYPVEIKYRDTALHPGRMALSVANSLVEILTATSGSVLVFLPGQAEIRAVATAVSAQLRATENCLLMPLFGDLDLETQQQAIAPAPPGQRKLVLATNIAETSLTIEGIRVVVDSGYCREARFDPNTAMTRLHTRRISLASATQRSGRAGRLEPGVCYRLWSASQQAEMPAHLPPDIQQADLASMALLLASWGIQQVDELTWLDPPPKGAWTQAQALLIELEAITPDGQITALGEAMAQLPCHPRLAHLLLRVGGDNNLKVASELAALLAERDPLRSQQTDIETRLDWLQQTPRDNKGIWHRLQQQAKQFRQLRRKLDAAVRQSAITEPLHPGLLLSLAYPDRIAQQRQPGGTEYLMSNGRAIRLQPDDPLCRQRWLAVASTRGQAGQRQDQISLAAPLDIKALATWFPQRIEMQEQIHWDNSGKRIIADRVRQLGALTLDRQRIDNPDPEQVNQALLAQLRNDGLEQLPWTPELRNWQQRVQFLHTHAPTQHQPLWPDMSDAALMATLEDWLLPFLQGQRSFTQLPAKDFKSALQSLLPWAQQSQLESLAPERIVLPSGSRASIDYNESPPVLAAKLQEMFGWHTSPTVGYGTPLKLHLLSPARRPVQITTDLAGFWRQTYAEVKKDLKGRYPKHDWPDDPLTATASRGVKRRPKP
ncbi:ATP-dependent helicase HrpB [Pontibacter sp. JAM-7]|uniref:ATP-dependent helicase HrpB n=1 Tax=Pontibacter sp. JAM-7 TaxID=3366581 RepID=UPI003AF62C28